MPPLFDDAVVSPELALVDPELAARARDALSPQGPQRRVAGASMLPAPTAPAARRRTRRVAAPALTLLATAAASLVVTAFTGPERASGEAREVRTSPEPQTPAAASESDQTPARSLTAAGVTAVRDTGSAPSAGTVAQPSLDLYEVEGDRTVSVGSTPAPNAAGQVERPHRVVASPRTLVWPRSRQASAYDLELVRVGGLIYSTRSSSPHVVLPRSWERAGVRYVIQPEDQVFVWPIVDGRRTATPAVDGILALDMTRIARLIAQSQGKTHP